MCNSLISQNSSWHHTNVKILVDKPIIAYKIVSYCDGVCRPWFNPGVFNVEAKNVWNGPKGYCGFTCYRSFRTALQSYNHSGPRSDGIAIAKIRGYHPVGSFDTSEVIGYRQRVTLVKEFKIIEFIKINS